MIITKTTDQINSIISLNNLTITGNESITNTIDATSTSTGALVISGGLGVAKTAYFGNKINIPAESSNGVAYFDSSKVLQSTTTLTDGQLIIGSSSGVPTAGNLTNVSNQTTITNGANSITIGTVQNIGTGSSPTFGNLTLTSQLALTGASNQLLIAPNGIVNPFYTINASANPGINVTYSLPVVGATANFVMSEGNQTINGSKSLSGITNITNTTDATSTSTGSLIISGGLGIAKTTYLNTTNNVGVLSVLNTTDATSTSTGSIIISGGIGIAKASYHGGIANMNNTTDATSTSTGSLIVAGGLGIAKTAYFGNNIVQPRWYMFAHNSTTQSISNTTTTLVAFDTTDHNSGITMNTNVFTIPHSGIFQVCFKINYATNATGFRLAYITVNDNAGTGARFGEFVLTTETSGTRFCCCGTAILFISANDTVRIWTFQSSGGNLNTGGVTSDTFNNLQISYLSEQ